MDAPGTPPFPDGQRARRRACLALFATPVRRHELGDSKVTFRLRLHLSHVYGKAPLQRGHYWAEGVCYTMLNVRDTDHSRSMTAAVRSPVFFRLHDH